MLATAELANSVRAVVRRWISAHFPRHQAQCSGGSDCRYGSHLAKHLSTYTRAEPQRCQSKWTGAQLQGGTPQICSAQCP
eukprot:1952749-Alexandrium_andersonii.AAC.1